MTSRSITANPRNGSAGRFIPPFLFLPLLAQALIFAASMTTLTAQTIDDFRTDPGFQVAGFAFQPDGKIVGRSHGYAAIRIDPDGGLDASFAPAVFDSYGSGVVVQRDGRIAITGWNNLYQLEASGSQLAFANFTTTSDLASLALQPDGKIVVSGSQYVNGSNQLRVRRVNSNGTKDDSLNLTIPVDYLNPAYFRRGELLALADGKVLVRGSIQTYGGQLRNGLLRFNADGTLDTVFAPAHGLPGSSIEAMALQADGRILVAGTFVTGVVARASISRLNPTGGSRDSTFSPELEGGGVTSLAVQADGRIIVAGYFTKLAGQSCTNLGRLNADGSFDPSFVAPPEFGSAESIGLQPDGRILFYGSTADGYYHLHRLNNTAPATQSLSYNGTNIITWLRGGTSPEVTHTTFEYSTNNGATWVNLGVGSRTAGGWRRGVPASFNLLTNVNVRARGYYTGGGGDGSSITEAIFGPKLMTSQPADRLVNAGSKVRFFVNVGGTGPFSYQWRKGTVDLTEGGRISGAQSATLTLSNVVAADAGGYSVVITDPSGSITSRVATLTVRDPVFVLQNLQSTYLNLRDNVAFSVVAAGTSPLSYQWHRGNVKLVDGGNVRGARTPTLSITNVLGGNAGDYFVVVSNSVGSITSIVATLFIPDPVVFAVPYNQWVLPGDPIDLTVEADGTALRYQWYKNGVKITGATNATVAFAAAKFSDAGDYIVEVTNGFGGVTVGPVSVGVSAATVDYFGVGVSQVAALVEQRDGQIILGGSGGLSRFSREGFQDSGFGNPVFEPVQALALQPDGRIIVGGSFGTIQNQTREGIGRLESDGTLSVSFLPGSQTNSIEVRALAVQPDGAVVIGGNFTDVRGVARTNLARVNASGILDLAFNPKTDGPVNSIVVLTNGDLLVGGSFLKVNGVAAAYSARLRPDGSLDESFISRPDGPVNCLLVQPDGRIVYGGNFRGMFGTNGYFPSPSLGRVKVDGSVDTAFAPTPLDFSENPATVYSLALQANGGILVGGDFVEVNAQPQEYVARLNSNGTLDGSFRVSADGMVRALGVQADAKILLAGDFVYLNYLSYQPYVSRLNNPDAPLDELSVAGSTVSWLRGGGVPEISSATFEFSTNETSWVIIGNGLRVSNGWQLASVTVPQGASLRARGLVTGGQGNASAWFTESVGGPPLIVQQPVGQTNWAGGWVQFGIEARGSKPLSYQWRRNGVPLQDNETNLIAGARSTVLTIGDVYGPASGAYTIVISNSFGSVTSLVANLTVIEPIISSQSSVPGSPTDVSVSIEDAFELSVSVYGTTPVSYRWTRNGVVLAGAITNPLVVSNAVAADAGEYVVTVSNAYGSTVSLPFIVSVNRAVPDFFNAGISNNFARVNALAIEADGSILAGGVFDDHSLEQTRLLIRFREDGSVDHSFKPAIGRNYFGFYPEVRTVAVQPDGKILVGGIFDRTAGTGTQILRLNADGTRDSTFNVTLGAYTILNNSLNEVNAIALEPGGKIYIGGSFRTVNGINHSCRARLNANGSLDNTFAPVALDSGSSYPPTILTLVLQPDGNLLAGGSFEFVNGVPKRSLVRLTSTGSVDAQFNGTDWSPYPTAVKTLILQSNGKILVWNASGSSYGLVRLNSDGTLDPAFQSIANGISIEAMVQQADGKIIVAGLFRTEFGSYENKCRRIHLDGTIDPSFGVSVGGGNYGGANTLAVQRDGRVLVGGGFNSLMNEPRFILGRLGATDPASEEIVYDGSTIHWQRRGGGPDFWRTTFELSKDGTTWSSLGSGTRIPGGWRSDGLIAPLGVAVRARGFVSGEGAGEWMAESVATGPLHIRPDTVQRQPFEFTLFGRAGQSAVIEGSTDLRHWIPIQTNVVAGNGLIQFTDPNASQFPHRFYRGRVIK